MRTLSAFPIAVGLTLAWRYSVARIAQQSHDAHDERQRRRRVRKRRPGGMTDSRSTVGIRARAHGECSNRRAAPVVDRRPTCRPASLRGLTHASAGRQISLVADATIDTFPLWWLGYPRPTHWTTTALRFTLLPSCERGRCLTAVSPLHSYAACWTLGVAPANRAMMRHVGGEFRIDIDAAAAAMASAAGLDVHVAIAISEFELNLRCVTLVHVIEHLPDPRAY